ncbi:hypothetical protein AAK894_06270 [Lachnospiraceae bacterium 46-61]
MSILLKDLMIAIPFTIKKITDINIVQKCNAHAVANITVVLEDGQNIQDIYSLNQKTNVVLKNKTNDTILFSGALMGITLSILQGVYTATLTVKSYTCFMDIKQKSRSFQYDKNTYQNIFQNIIQNDYQGDFIDTASNGKTQDNIIIQYHETDWEFLLRVASQIHAVVIADIFSDKPKMYIGVPHGENHKSECYHYQITRQTADYMLQQQYTQQKSLLDFTYLDIETEQNYNMGDNVIFQNISFVIMEKQMQLKHSKIICKYKMCKKEGIFINSYDNNVLKGVSIEGKVIDVKRDCLKLHLCIDETQDVNQAHWFPYNTPYAAEGQTGFYSMPQIGDSVLLYCPKSCECECYVKTTVRKQKHKNSETNSIEQKCLETIHNKKMMLSPTQYCFSTEKSSIDMTYQSGMAIISCDGIKIHTDSFMRLEANKIIVEGRDRVVAITPSANVVVDEIMHFKA